MVIDVVVLVIAVGAAARSTWSPCGHSMLSTITPVGEQGRTNRYRTTVVSFIVGSVTGGMVLGGCAALGAIAAAGLATRTMEFAGALILALAVLFDGHVGGLQLPIHRRQVNETWLDRFRAAIYGFGFGFEIGCGLATYIMTAAVYACVALAIVSGKPWLALGAGALFGLVRGLAVLLGRHITSVTALISFHQRFTAFEPRVEAAVVTLMIAGSAALCASVWIPAGPIVAFALGGTVVASGWVRRARHSTGASLLAVPAAGAAAGANTPL